jgi:hypothetical protein
MKNPVDPCIVGKHLSGLRCCAFMAVLLTVSPSFAAELYTQGPGKDATFQELIDQGVIVRGSKEGKPIQGTKINVNNTLLESNLKDLNGTVRPDRIHTHVNSNISKKEFDQWSRWYQEDGNTQVFRLFQRSPAPPAPHPFSTRSGPCR